MTSKHLVESFLGKIDKNPPHFSAPQKNISVRFKIRMCYNYINNSYPIKSKIKFKRCEFYEKEGTFTFRCGGNDADHP